MSRTQSYRIPCPKCKAASDQIIYHSINTSINDAVLKIINDKINYVTCPTCSNTFQVKTGLLFNNMDKSYAVYYNPTSFESIEEECNNIKKMLGETSYLANPEEFSDWGLFKEEIKKKEGINTNIKLKKSNLKIKNNMSPLDYFWSCNICDGDSDTGCLYFDPSECPRH